LIAAQTLRPSIPGAFRAEVLKVSRQLSVWLMLLGGVVLLGIVVLASTTSGPFKDHLARDPSLFINDVVEIYGTMFQVGSGIVLLIVASRLLSMEYSGGTVRILYARGVGRVQLLLTKMAAVTVFGLLLLAGYLVVVGVIVATTVRAWSGSLTALGQVSTEEWQNVERALVFYVANIVVLVLVAAAAAALGRSLTFALPAALALFPADNFTSIICALVANATRHQHPWLDINQWFLGPNLNNLLSLWETTQPRPAFAIPEVKVDLTHTVLVIAAWSVAMGLSAVARTARPDVLE